ncbi:MAG: nitroreductase family protein [Bacteroidales bacterium]|nr:nitroreductase family protein [Bacteroidales bacterium]
MIRQLSLIAASLAAIMVLPGCGSNQKDGAAAASASFDEIVATRRSVRDYKEGTTISEAQVRDLVATAMEAPSWANSQTTRYYVAMDPQKVAAVKELVGAGNARNTAGAPVMIVSTFVKGQSGFGRGSQVNEVGDGWGAYDNGVSNAYFILKAREQGFDTLIMGMRDSDGLRKLFNIPDTEQIMAVISLGYRASDPNRPARKSLDEIVKFY